MSDIKLDPQKGLTVPVKTTTEKNAIASPEAGAVLFDSTLGKLCVYSGTSSALRCRSSLAHHGI